MKKDVLKYIILIIILFIVIVVSTVLYIIYRKDSKENVYINNQIGKIEVSYTNNKIENNNTSNNNETYSDLYDKAKKIGEKYDVVIEIAENVPDYALYGTSERQYDEEKINFALDKINSILSIYPNGFFKQLMYDNYQELHIYIIGFCSIGMGVASYNEDFNFIVMDAEDKDLIEAFDYNLNHEIAHIIDRKLEYVSNIEEGHLFSETNWKKLNPKGFEYSEGESDEVTMERYDGFGSYFAYSYGAKNAKEDRATIFGFCTSAYIEGGGVALGEGAIKKLDFYSECIRAAFDTEGWPEETPWEYRKTI